MKGIICSLAIAIAMAQVTQPFAGYIVDRNHHLRPVLGIAGNFVLGDSIAESVLSVASSGRVALAKTNDEVWTLIAGSIVDRRPAPAGPVVFAFDSSGNPRTAQFPEARVLWRWKDGEPVAEDLDIEPATLTDEIELPDNKLVVKLPATVKRVEPMGSAWVVAYTDAGIFAVRARDGAMFQVPETAE